MNNNHTGVRWLLAWLFVLEAFGACFWLGWYVTDPTFVFPIQFKYSFGFVIPGIIVLILVGLSIVEIFGKKEVKNGK